MVNLKEYIIKRNVLKLIEEFEKKSHLLQLIDSFKEMSLKVVDIPVEVFVEFIKEIKELKDKIKIN